MEEVYPFGEQPRKLPEVNNPVNSGPFSGPRMRQDPLVKRQEPAYQGALDVLEQTKLIKTKADQVWSGGLDNVSVGMAIAYSLALIAQALLQGFSVLARSIRESK